MPPKCSQPETLLEKTFSLSPTPSTRSRATLAKKLDDADCYLIPTRKPVLEDASSSAPPATTPGAPGGRGRGQQGYAHTDDVKPEALLRPPLPHGPSPAKAGDLSAAVRTATRPEQNLLSRQLSCPGPADEKVWLLTEIDRRAGRRPRIVQVMASLSCEEKIVVIACADGRIVADRQPLAPAGHPSPRRRAAAKPDPSAAAGAGTTPTSSKAASGRAT